MFGGLSVSPHGCCGRYIYTSLVLFLFLFFFSDFTEDEDLPGAGPCFQVCAGASHQSTVAADLALLPILASSLLKAVKALCQKHPHVRFSSEYHATCECVLILCRSV